CCRGIRNIPSHSNCCRSGEDAERPLTGLSYLESSTPTLFFRTTYECNRLDSCPEFWIRKSANCFLDRHSTFTLYRPPGIRPKTASVHSNVGNREEYVCV